MELESRGRKWNWRAGVAVAAAAGVFGVLIALSQQPLRIAQPELAAIAGSPSAAPADGVMGRVADGMGSACHNCGVVEAVRSLYGADSSGGMAGERKGDSGRTVLGVLGAVGGAYGGHVGQRDGHSGVAFRVTVRMTDGSARTVYSVLAPTFVIGDRVRVVNGSLAAQG